MNARFVVLVMLSLLPWLYVGALVLTDQLGELAGFEYLPFFGLLFAKELALESPAERAEADREKIPLRRLPVILLLSVLLAGVAMIGGASSSSLAGQDRRWIGWLLAAGFVLVVIRADVRRAAARSMAPGALRPSEARPEG